jgi:chromosome segregation ATPase
MDRRKFLAVYEKARQTYGNLNDFITKEYIKTKTLEEAFQLLTELQNVQKQLETISAERDQIKSELTPVEKEIVELEQKIAGLKTKGPIDNLNVINAEIETLNCELKHSLRHFQKPFIKMQALATSGGGAGVTPDELTKVTQYLEKPFEALATEQTGYPALKEILEKLTNLMAEDKLKLKDEKARKAEQSIGEVLKQDSLQKLQLKSVELAKVRDELLVSAQLDEIRRNLSTFMDQLEQLKGRKASIETHRAVKENSYNEAIDKISNLKRSIEKDVFSSISIRIQIA